MGGEDGSDDEEQICTLDRRIELSLIYIAHSPKSVDESHVPYAFFLVTASLNCHAFQHTVDSIISVVMMKSFSQVHQLFNRNHSTSRRVSDLQLFT